MQKELKNEKKRFCIVENAYAQAAKPASWAEIVQLMGSATVNNVAKSILALDPQAADYEEQKSKLKKQLPCITVHACSFTDSKRSNKTAVSNGLASLDIDHITADEGNKIKSLLTKEFCQEHGIIFASRSVSAYGIWMLVETGYGESLIGAQERMKHVLNQRVSGIAAKVDAATKDMARLRYLTPLNYMLYADNEALAWDLASERVNELTSERMSELEAYIQSLPTEVAVGQRHTTYKEWALQALALAGSAEQVLQALPDLGLPENERKSLITWTDSTIEDPKPSKATIAAVEEVIAKSHKQAVDIESLPLPRVPDLIFNLVKPLPKKWRQTATLALLPSLSVACGKVSYGKKQMPLAFQVAVYGKAGSGKSQFTCGPAQLVQQLIGGNDNHYIELIDKYERQQERTVKDEEKIDVNQLRSPQVLGFNSSTIMLAKYLKYSNKETIMLYSDEIGETLGASKGSSFLDLKSLLRKGYDGAEHTFAYKERDSFRGKIYPRISYLACGTPNDVFKYFDDNATESGTARRCIFVEHTKYDQIIPEYWLDNDTFLLVSAEIQQLTRYAGNVHHEQIEAAYRAYITSLQAAWADDEILQQMVFPTAQHMLRATYLAHVLNHYDEQKVAESVAFGKWVGDYFIANFMNHKYAYLHKQAVAADKYFAPSSETTDKQLNEQMFNELNTTFTKHDVIRWRRSHGLSDDLSILYRWRKRGRTTKNNNGEGYLKVS